MGSWAGWLWITHWGAVVGVAVRLVELVVCTSDSGIVDVSVSPGQLDERSGTQDCCEELHADDVDEEDSVARICVDGVPVLPRRVTYIGKALACLLTVLPSPNTCKAQRHSSPAKLYAIGDVNLYSSRTYTPYAPCRALPGSRDSAMHANVPLDRVQG